MNVIRNVGLAVTLGFGLAATGAAAQTVGFGSTPGGGWTNSAANAIAKVVVENTKIQMRVQPQGSQPLNNVNADVLQFGIANTYDSSFFRTGTGFYEGNGEKKNLRVAAVLAPLYGALYVRKDSDMKTIKDIKGKKVSSEFSAQKSVRQSMTGLLANGGLTWKDVVGIPAPTVPRSAQDFIAGKTDILYFALGSALVIQAAAKVGGLRVLQLDNSPEALKRLTEHLPGSAVEMVQPGKGREGLDVPTNVLRNFMLVNTNSKVSDDIVYNVLKALHDHKQQLVSTFPGLRGFEPVKMYMPVPGMEYHPGAIKFFKDTNQWKGAS
ncbi:MAG: TAXI family TRAP transporter solute-binding subunit [Rhizobiales bacterium]|nr:TAXI family TRAP transporter solute-binding subunit [Hyphomicrobiales bacterium]